MLKTCHHCLLTLTRQRPTYFPLRSFLTTSPYRADAALAEETPTTTESAIDKNARHGHRPAAEGKPAKGLYQFFSDQYSMPFYREDANLEHGGVWQRGQLRRKSFEDLHTLWYVCLREKNVIATELAERHRLKMPINDKYFSARKHLVRQSMRNIKEALTERQMSYEQAMALRAQKETAEVGSEQDTIAASEMTEPTEAVPLKI